MLQETLTKDLIAAQKAKDTLRVSVIRFLRAGIKNKEIELRTSGDILDEAAVIVVLTKQIKQRKDSIENYKQAGRDDLVANETAELKILEEYQA